MSLQQNMKLKNVVLPITGFLREGLSQDVLFFTSLQGKFVFQKSVLQKCTFILTGLDRAQKWQSGNTITSCIVASPHLGQTGL